MRWVERFGLSVSANRIWQAADGAWGHSGNNKSTLMPDPILLLKKTAVCEASLVEDKTVRLPGIQQMEGNRG